MNKTFLLTIFSLIILNSCKEKDEPVEVNRDLAGIVAGKYSYIRRTDTQLTRFYWDIYKLSDSTVAIKSVYGQNGYPGDTLYRIDSIPMVKLTELNKIDLKHTNTSPYTYLRPGGYILTATGEFKNNNLIVDMSFIYSTTIKVQEKVTLTKVEYFSGYSHTKLLVSR